ncbi:sulfite exporter TauE/SafE family protein [Frankia sp. AgB1.9]|uniref:sulfite exporter TauE/SafE family protein n=1 Tax=unclassified Frankia TaxID=2632575 RepID=UPI001932E7E0|nr:MULTISPECIES: sulfite exporter TauE/SafE family protein [unclassified Frankia]MBL7489770.1 sulfite exporter TauE/SafE family protein [Frankia sp. AgW1.1]MBL7552627.1 sulfite exporter TauE/SafE family protein [Frankia sp. AgB1.9]MBL7623715.1 sulfite exporter TauE/SafE family protein [Frankia sp. AgB1.8]
MTTIVSGFVAGLVLATVTAPVGVSGAVFLLPVQLDLLSVPSPAVTPTNLLYNVIATPGSLLRYHQQKQLGGALVRRMIAGTLPGVVLGAVVRVRYAPGAALFHVLLACLLLPLGVWLCARTLRSPRRRERPPVGSRAVTLLALAVGFVGGVYGIGGGSILGPILVGRGMPVATVAPATLASTFVTSIAGAATYAVLALTTPGNISPHWALGLACGVGGLTGGYLGARLQPKLPNTALQLTLGGLAIAVATLYLAEAT